MVVAGAVGGVPQDGVGVEVTSGGVGMEMVVGVVETGVAEVAEVAGVAGAAAAAARAGGALSARQLRAGGRGRPRGLLSQAAGSAADF